VPNFFLVIYSSSLSLSDNQSIHTLLHDVSESLICSTPEHRKTDFRPIVIFRLFFSYLQYQLLCDNTNAYAKAKEARGGSRHWYDVTINEMKVFFACMIWMGIKRTRSVVG
jgi:hypothetical protein